MSWSSKPAGKRCAAAKRNYDLRMYDRPCEPRKMMQFLFDLIEVSLKSIQCVQFGSHKSAFRYSRFTSRDAWPSTCPSKNCCSMTRCPHCRQAARGHSRLHCRDLESLG